MHCLYGAHENMKTLDVMIKSIRIYIKHVPLNRCMHLPCENRKLCTVAITTLRHYPILIVNYSDNHGDLCWKKPELKRTKALFNLINLVVIIRYSIIMNRSKSDATDTLKHLQHVLNINKMKNTERWTYNTNTIYPYRFSP